MLRVKQKSVDELDLTEGADNLRIAERDDEAARQRVAALQAAMASGDRLAFLEAKAEIQDAERASAHAEAALGRAKKHYADVAARVREERLARHRPLIHSAAQAVVTPLREALVAYERKYLPAIAEATEDVGVSPITYGMGSPGFSVLAVWIAHVEAELGSL